MSETVSSVCFRYFTFTLNKFIPTVYIQLTPSISLFNILVPLVNVKLFFNKMTPNTESTYWAIE